MTSIERPGKDLVPTGLDGELRNKFNDMLQNAADHLELFSTPDEFSYNLKHMAFGNTRESLLTVSHTTDRGYHSGNISYVDTQNPERSFVLENRLSDGTTWTTSGGRYESIRVLQRLRGDWPYDHSRDELNELITDARPKDVDSPASEIPVERVFAIVENYALQEGTGDIEHEKRWDYREACLDNEGMLVGNQSLSFVVINDEQMGLRQVRADITVSYEVDGAIVPLTFHVHSDELGDTLVNATYKSPLTNQESSVPIKDYTACFDEVNALLEKLVAEKTGASSNV